MKKVIIKIMAFALALSMLTVVMSGCGGQSMKVKVGVKLGDDYVKFRYAQNADDPDFIITQEERNFLNDYEVEISYNEGDKVSALQALIEASQGRLNIATDEEGNSLVGVADKFRGFTYDPSKDAHVEGYDSTITFFWECKINGSALTEGRAGNNYVKDGDVITFTLTSAGASSDLVH